MESEFCKLEIFLPESHLEAVQQAAPYLGRMGEVCHAPELKVEVTCRTDRVEETVAAVKRAHPYEEPVINVIPLYRTGL